MNNKHETEIKNYLQITQKEHEYILIYKYIKKIYKKTI